MSVTEVVALRDDTTAHIAKARSVLKPKEVKLHKVPAWLATRLRAFRKKLKLKHVPSSMLLESTYGYASASDNIMWFDHWGTSAGGPFKCCHEAGVFSCRSLMASDPKTRNNSTPSAPNLVALNGTCRRTRGGTQGRRFALRFTRNDLDGRQEERA